MALTKLFTFFYKKSTLDISELLSALSVRPYGLLNTLFLRRNQGDGTKSRLSL